MVCAPAAIDGRGRGSTLLMNMPFEVRRSAVHGRGGFATQMIPAGSRIGEYAGERISNEEGLRRHALRSANGQVAGDYAFGLDADTLIDGLSQGNDTAFINHGCEPNCRFVRNGGRIFIDATRDIPEGGELLLDYKLHPVEPMSPEQLSAFECSCGAPTCRGTMLSVCVASLATSERPR